MTSSGAASRSQTANPAEESAADGAPEKPEKTKRKPAGDAVTPMMAQYLAIKADHANALLFYRMGDFYELFFDDARAAAEALDIALTKRGKHLGADIPMCGVPVHSHETYLNRLIKKGFKVAVCEQTEDPAEARKRGAKAVVARAVVRLVTPGTLTEDALLDARRNNYLAALADAQGTLGLAWIDMSTGTFETQALDATDLGAALARLAAGELLIADGLTARPDIGAVLAETGAETGERLTPLPQSRFDSVNGEKRLKALYGVKTLDAFGDFSRAELAAAGALVDYVELTQKGRMPRISRPRRIKAGTVMQIDAWTRRNLELCETLTGEVRGSLLGAIDRTVTGAGARLLAARLAAPLTVPAAINRRLDAVQFLVSEDAVRDGVRQRLKHAPDIERALTRLALGRGGPRDLAQVRDGLIAAADIRAVLETAGAAPPVGIVDAIDGLGRHDDTIELLARALADALPLLARDGGFIAAGYAPDLDELRQLRDDGRRLIAGLQSRYAEMSGIQGLKIKHNNVLGYFIEISAKQADKIPIGAAADENSPFIHRQTMANAVRYSTVELGELEGKIAKAADRALALELDMFESLTAEVLTGAEVIQAAAGALAGLDLAQGLAHVAGERRHVRPVVDDSLDFHIEGGRHPVVEAAQEDAGDGAFVANDCRLSGSDAADGRVWLLTGPNMAGKSTFLRQNALIAIIAQIGAYVPAAAARIGVVDRLYSRVGAADDLARGRSTFMVEMVETAAILNQAGPRALVILDEIGRGTATFDGLSIAWAVVEHLHEVNRCRALFATHYHELTALAARLPGLHCHTMRVKEWQGDVVFLHEVAPGAADRSYGIHVGELAGLPKSVVGRAGAVLKTLEAGEQSSAMTRLADDLPLFQALAEATGGPGAPGAAGAAGAERGASTALVRALAEIDADALSPRDALDAMYRLKALLAEDDDGSC